jgi:hypothetical protein
MCSVWQPYEPDKIAAVHEENFREAAYLQITSTLVPAWRCQSDTAREPASTGDRRSEPSHLGEPYVRFTCRTRSTTLPPPG